MVNIEGSKLGMYSQGLRTIEPCKKKEWKDSTFGQLFRVVVYNISAVSKELRFRMSIWLESKSVIGKETRETVNGGLYEF